MNRVLTLLVAATLTAAPALAQNLPERAAKAAKKDGKAEPAKPAAKKAAAPKKKSPIGTAVERAQKK